MSILYSPILNTYPRACLLNILLARLPHTPKSNFTSITCSLHMKNLSSVLNVQNKILHSQNSSKLSPEEMFVLHLSITLSVVGMVS